MKRRNRLDLDVAIVGGGIAGLWVLNRLVAGGIDAGLFEARALGSGQTIASQGIIHGGLKYALGASLTSAHDAIAAMHDRWRACLAGRGEIDLTGITVLSPRCYLWANDGTLGKLGGFLASRLLRGRVEHLGPGDYPPAFARGFAGNLYAIDDFVLDTRSLLERLANPLADRITRLAIEPASLQFAAPDHVDAIVTDAVEIRARTFVFAAGAGNEALLADIIDAPTMQRRPLHQVTVRHDRLPPLYAHCIADVTNNEPRLTVSTHDDQRGARVWYIGGQLASAGATRNPAQQVEAARHELAASMPWLDLRDAIVETHRYERAEPRTPLGLRPDTAFVARHGNVIVVWPTKLTLAPDLGDQVMAAMGHVTKSRTPRLESAAAKAKAPLEFAEYPWC